MFMFFNLVMSKDNISRHFIVLLKKRNSQIKFFKSVYEIKHKIRIFSKIKNEQRIY
jgi:hypothetical protein